MKSRKKFLVSLLALLSVGIMSLSATACELDDLQGLLDGADIDVNVNVGEKPDDGTDDDGSTADGGTTDEGTTDDGSTGGNGSSGIPDAEKSKIWEEYFKYELNADGESYTVRINDMGEINPESTSITAPLVIPDSYNNLPVTTIGTCAFACLATESVTIPNSITSIGIASFGGCSNIKDVVIPDSVVSMGEGVFYGCTSLISVTIPKVVTSIGDGVFMDCSSLTNVTIPDSVTSIGDRAFYNCTSLTSVTIPDSVVSIGNEVFYGCTSLTSITFEGTIAQWNAIEKGYKWNYNVPATKVVCSDGEVEL